MSGRPRSAAEKEGKRELLSALLTVVALYAALFLGAWLIGRLAPVETAGPAYASARGGP